MTIFIKAKLKKLDDDQTNINKYRVAARILRNIILYHNFKLITIPKFRRIGQLFHLKNVYVAYLKFRVRNLHKKRRSNFP